MGEQVAVSNADTECIGSTIGEAANGDVLRSYGIAAKYRLQCSINQGNIRTVFTRNYIPCLLTGGRRKQNQSIRIS